MKFGMRRFRLRKKAIIWAIVVLLSLFLVGLRLIILVTERTVDNDQILLPSDQDKTINHLLVNEINSARKHVNGFFSECAIPSLTIAVSINQKLVWSEAFGYANMEKKQLATRHTKYRVNSVSKLFTAALAARFHEQGKLDLDRDIRKYLPGFPDKGYPITSRQLASHQGGIRNYRDDAEAVQKKHYSNVSQSLELFKNDPLVFRPGTGFLYSGYGYVLLSAVIEKAGAKDFLELMREEVFTPLGMNHTGEAADSGITDEATCYDYVSPYSPDGSIVLSPPNDFSFKWAAGGFVSTAEDLVRFGNAHINLPGNNFLQSESINQLFKPLTRQMGILGYGMGWMSARDPHLRKAYFHFGAGSGGTSLLMVYPNQKITIAILSNLGHAKFQYNHIIGIANSFQPSPTKIIFNCWLVIVLAWLLFALYRYFRKPGIAK
jgi:serine beta-lactamase-like protein LACTB, mitochondrial